MKIVCIIISILFFLIYEQGRLLANDTSFVQLKVKGMMCKACEAKVANVLEGVNGITTYKIDTNSDLVKVGFDSKQLKKQKILSLVASTGYETEFVN